MLICKYTRLGNAAFVPHLDMLRAVTMGVRRIGAKAAYSEGFNPHMKIFFGQPLPIGAESVCEYFCLYADEEPEDFRARINASLPDGVRVTAAARTDSDPNVAKIMCYADYTVTMRDVQPDFRRLEGFLQQPTCEIEYLSKGELQHKDVKPLIRSIRAESDKTLCMRLCCGNKNLRADRLMQFLHSAYRLCGGYDILKTNMYDCEGNDLDTILFGSSL